MLYAIKYFLIYQRAACGSGFTCLRMFPEHTVKLPVHYNNQDRIKKHERGPRNVFFTEHEVSFETYVLHQLHNERISLLRCDFMCRKLLNTLPYIDWCSLLQPLPNLKKQKPLLSSKYHQMGNWVFGDF